MTVKPTDHNPAMGWDDHGRMSHWRCTISYGRKRMTITFSMGQGHCGREPELSDVMPCLFADASGYERSNGFEDWAQEYGYDTDSRAAERTYRAVEKQSMALRELLGDNFGLYAKQYEEG